MSISRRILSDITLKHLPRVSDRSPSVYVERAKVSIDGASIKIITAKNEEHRVPIATTLNLLLGPGTSITHEAVKAAAKVNTNISWVGEDSLVYYAHSHNPTATASNVRKQAKLFSDATKRERVARNMFSFRFGSDVLLGKTIKEMMGMEGYRIKSLYKSLSEKYEVPWEHRKYHTYKWDNVDVTNRAITAFNSALYSLVLSAVYGLGYIPQLGFIHTGGGLPFVYDIADLYKEEVCFEAAFSYRSKNNVYDRASSAEHFREVIIKDNILSRLPKDIERVFQLT